MSLSEQDREALRRAIIWMSVSEPPDPSAVGLDLAAVEAIVARHVAAALEAAAEAIEAVNAPPYMGQKRDAYEDAARIVRTHDSPARPRP